MNVFKTLSLFERTILVAYILASFLLLLYSFTQIDLGLVISRFPFLYTIEKTFQYVGYFNRTLSTGLFIALVVLFSVLYWYVIRYLKNISRKALWTIIIALSALLFFSYNAFSYDLFNYIFDAKILTHYHQNPYQHKALDYPADPMLSFMHWTHRVYPYGPVWLVVTVPLSFLGLGIFLPTLYLFKLLMLLSYVGTAYFIGRIIRIISPKSEIFGIALFALNPLVIFETLVSSHNDIFMLFLLVLSLYLLLQKKTVWSVLAYIASVGTKFATIFFLPIYGFLLYKKGKVSEKEWDRLMLLGTGLLFLAVVAVSYRTNFQPWYLLYVLPFVSLITMKRSFFYPVLFLSLAALANYIPYLYMGTWTSEIMTDLFWLNSLMGIIGVGWFVSVLREPSSK